MLLVGLTCKCFFLIRSESLISWFHWDQRWRVSLVSLVLIWVKKKYQRNDTSETFSVNLICKNSVEALVLLHSQLFSYSYRKVLERCAMQPPFAFGLCKEPVMPPATNCRICCDDVTSTKLMSLPVSYVTSLTSVIAVLTVSSPGLMQKRLFAAQMQWFVLILLFNLLNFWSKEWGNWLI